MDIKKGTKLKLRWQFLNEGEPVLLSDYSKFRLDVLDGKKVPQRTSVTLVDNEVAFTIDTAKYETGRFSVRVDADGADGGLHVCHRDAFRIVPANVKSSLAKGGNGENYELTVKDDLVGQTQTSASAKWGKITGQIAEQEDLMGKLRDKQDKLIDRGTVQNIKTLNGESLLGVGNLLVGGIKKLPIVGGGTGDAGTVDLTRLTSGVYATEGWGDAIVWFTFGDKNFQFEKSTLFIISAFEYELFEIVAISSDYENSYNPTFKRISADKYTGEWVARSTEAKLSDIGSLKQISEEYAVFSNYGYGVLTPGTYAISDDALLRYADGKSMRLGSGILTVYEVENTFGRWDFIGYYPGGYSGSTAFIKDIGDTFPSISHLQSGFVQVDPLYLPPNEWVLGEEGRSELFVSYNSDVTVQLTLHGSYDNFVIVKNTNSSDTITVNIASARVGGNDFSLYTPSQITIEPNKAVKLTIVECNFDVFVTASEPLVPVNA